MNLQHAMFCASRVTDISKANAAFSVILTVAILVVLIRYNWEFNLSERLGYGIAGAAAFLSMFKQLGYVELMLPFNDLYQFGWRLGWFLVIGGKIWRMERHIRRNKATIRLSKRHFAANAAADPK